MSKKEKGEQAQQGRWLAHLPFNQGSTITHSFWDVWLTVIKSCKIKNIGLKPFTRDQKNKINLSRLRLYHARGHLIRNRAGKTGDDVGALCLIVDSTRVQKLGKMMITCIFRAGCFAWVLILFRKSGVASAECLDFHLSNAASSKFGTEMKA